MKRIKEQAREAIFWGQVRLDGGVFFIGNWKRERCSRALKPSQFAVCLDRDCFRHSSAREQRGSLHILNRLHAEDPIQGLILWIPYWSFLLKTGHFTDRQVSTSNAFIFPIAQLSSNENVLIKSKSVSRLVYGYSSCDLILISGELVMREDTNNRRDEKKKKKHLFFLPGAHSADWLIGREGHVHHSRVVAEHQETQHFKPATTKHSQKKIIKTRESKVNICCNVISLNLSWYRYRLLHFCNRDIPNIYLYIYIYIYIYI